MDDLCRLRASQEIAELVTRYNRAVDDRRVRDIAPLFTEDGTLETMGQVITGRAALTAMFSAAGTEPLDRPLTAHHVSNLLLDFDGDTAAGESDFLVVRRTADGVEMTLAGRYNDRFRRDDGVWRFSYRKTIPIARTDS